MSAALNTPRPRQDLRIAVLLAAAAAVATLAVIPYLLQIDPARMTGGGAIALPALVAIQAMSMFILCALLAWSGLRMGHRVGLGAPLLQHWVSRHGDARIRDRKPWQAMGLGVVVLFRMSAGCPAKHCAIVSEVDRPEPRMIHAYWGRSVVESWMGAWWRRRLIAVFRWPTEV